MDATKVVLVAGGNRAWGVKPGASSLRWVTRAYRAATTFANAS